MQSFGLKIKKLRESKNLTQQQIANELNVRVTSVSNWENNVSKPKLDIVQKLACILDVDLSDLVSENDLDKIYVESNYERIIEAKDELILYLKKRIAELEESSAKKDSDLNKSAV